MAASPSGQSARPAGGVGNSSPQHDGDGDAWLACQTTVHTVDLDPYTHKAGNSIPEKVGPYAFIANAKAKYILLYDDRNRAATRMDTSDPGASGWFLVGTGGEARDDIRMESNQTTVDEEHISLRRVSSHKSSIFEGRFKVAKTMTIGRDDLMFTVKEENYDADGSLLSVETNRGQCWKIPPQPVDSWPTVGHQF